MKISTKKALLIGLCSLLTIGASAARKDAYDRSRIFWDTDTKKTLFSSGNYARMIQLQDGRLMVINAQNLLQGLQKLHADVNIPADAVRVLHALHLVAGDHVPADVQLLRQGVLVDEPLHLVFVMGGNILLAEGLGI